jgi:hypothetical protein
VHARIAWRQLEQSGQFLASKLNQILLALSIKLAHSPDVAHEVTLLDETGHHDLLQRGRLTVT